MRKEGRTTKFGELLTQLRQDRRMSQAELGRVIFVSGGTISNYEHGVHYPDVEKLIALADYFQVTVDYLLGRSTSNVSPDVFKETIQDGVTVGDMMQSLQHLSPARKCAVCTTIMDMEVASIVHISRKKERM